MSLPGFSTQSQLFSTAGLSGELFAPSDRYRLFAKKVYPALVRARAQLEGCYCADNGRAALEPVVMLGVSLLQYLEGVPDRQAAEMLRYHAGWNFALNRQVGDKVFHPTTLVYFRQRLLDHDLSTIAFTAVLEALVEAGLITRKNRQRLDSTQMFGRVAWMSRLDCVRESLRLALKELEGAVPPEARPVLWIGLWERYVESQTDYRVGSETLARKLAESGVDAWQLLEWLRDPARSALAAGAQAQLLARVFAEQFEVKPGQTAPASREKIAVAVSATAPGSEALAGKDSPMIVPPEASPTPGQDLAGNPIPPPGAEPPAGADQALGVAPRTTAATPAEQAVVGQPQEDQTREPVQPRDKKELASDRVQNPHDPDATYAAKGKGEKKKEHVGYKVQIAETVSEAVLSPGEPTRNFISGIVTHAARESDEEGAEKMEWEQRALGLEKPPVHYVDAAYISAQKLAEAAAEGRELIGPAPGPSQNNDGRFTSERFNVNVEQRQALCPAGHENTQCSRLEEASTGRIFYRFEWDTATCAACPLRSQCIKAEHKHRTLVVGEHHTALQTRRQEQQTKPFKERMRHRNAIEGTQSELVRAHGLRRARYRGLAKARLQNYFGGAACNIKRWLRRTAWEMQNALQATPSPATAG
jgi:hypothetical protein